MERRTFIRAVSVGATGGLAGLSGCSAPGGNGEETTEPEDEAGEDGTTTEGDETEAGETTTEGGRSVFTRFLLGFGRLLVVSAGGGTPRKSG